MHRVSGNPPPCPSEEGKSWSWEGVGSGPTEPFDCCGPLRSHFTSLGLCVLTCKIKTVIEYEVHGTQ